MRLPTSLALLALALASAPALAADAKAGQARFQQLCAACHGPAGKGDGAAAVALKPKPRDLTNAAWQASVKDAYLRDVIAKGGAAVGKSPLMAPFGASLPGEQLANVVAYIRSLKR